MITFNPDKFGFYQVDNFTSFSKYEALEQSRKTNQTVEWNFNRSVFDTIDWTKEPDMDLWEMYKARARQIREAYDYVVLWYSGGSDSHNLLLAWIDAGLKIDEIATTWNFEASGDNQDHYNAEITNVVLPDIKKLKESGIDFKFRLIDISTLCTDLFTTWGTEFEYNVNFHFSPNNPAKHLIRDKIQDYKDIISSGKKLCFVWGKEKPIIQYENGKHYAVFADNIDNCVGPYVQRNYYRGWYDELFYWSPDYPLIPVKQAHIIKKFAENCNDRNQCYSPRPNRYPTTGYVKKFDMYLSVPLVKLLLYPKWSNEIFCNGKSGSFTYSLRDRWFFQSNLDKKERFMQIVDGYYGLLSPESSIKRRSIDPQFSPKYFLEK
jgi:hypothetical protein